MLNLAKVIKCLEKGNIEFNKNVFIQTKDIYVTFVSKAGKKISMIFDSSKGFNPIKTANIEFQNGDSLVKGFSVNDYMPQVLNIVKHSYVGGENVAISETSTRFSKDVIKGGKPLDSATSLSYKVDGRWITESKSADYRQNYLPMSGSGRSNTI